MFSRRLVNSPLFSGLIVGLVFGSANLVFAWLYPLEDDTAGALLRFYGPMFCIWILASFQASRRSGRLLSGMTTGAIVAFTTFAVFDLLVLLRVNLLLNELTGRADWQNMMLRYHNSGGNSLRVFVNVDYIKGLPIKTGAASVIGGLMGVIGGCFARVKYRRPILAA